MRIKSKGEKVFSVVNYALLALLGVAFVLPYVLILVMSFTSTDSYYHKGYSLFPESLTLEGYRMIFGRGSEIYTAFYNTLLITFLGTLIGLVCTAPVAYALSRKRLFGRRFFNGLIVFAMLFSEITVQIIYFDLGRAYPFLFTAGVAEYAEYLLVDRRAGGFGAVVLYPHTHVFYVHSRFP